MALFFFFFKSLPDDKPDFLGFWVFSFFFFFNLPDQEDLDIFRKPPKKQDTPRSLFEQMASVRSIMISYISVLNPY